jgi:hypothetical protein
MVLNQDMLVKTKLCSFWREGRCAKGENCKFAHGDGEVEFQPDLTKTSLCLAWKFGGCRLSSEQCRFAHGMNEIRHVLPEEMLAPQRSEHSGTDISQEIVASLDPSFSAPKPLGLQSSGAHPRPDALPFPVFQDSTVSRSAPEPPKVPPAWLLRNCSPFESKNVPSNLSSLSPDRCQQSLSWDLWEADTVDAFDTSSDDGSRLSVPLQVGQVHDAFPDASQLSWLIDLDEPGKTEFLYSPIHWDLDSREGNADSTRTIQEPLDFRGPILDVESDPVHVPTVPESSPKFLAVGHAKMPGSAFPIPAPSTMDSQLQQYSAFPRLPGLW